MNLSKSIVMRSLMRRFKTGSRFSRQERIIIRIRRHSLKAVRVIQFRLRVTW